MGQFAIEPAKHGGFVVCVPFGPHIEREIVFAGRLDDCLSFLRRQFVLHDNKQEPHLQAVTFDLRTEDGRIGAKAFSATFAEACLTGDIPEAAQFAWETARDA